MRSFFPKLVSIDIPSGQYQEGTRQPIRKPIRRTDGHMEEEVESRKFNLQYLRGRDNVQMKKRWIRCSVRQIKDQRDESINPILRPRHPPHP